MNGKPAGLSIVIISDSPAASNRARTIAERLAPDLRAEITLLSHTWQLEVLSNPSISRADQRAVLGADVIIVSAQGEAALPSHLETWLLSMPENGIQPSALVALLDQVQDQDTLPRLLTLRSYLREIAQERKMQFLCPRDQWQPLELGHGSTP